MVTVTKKGDIHISYLNTSHKTDFKSLQLKLNKIFERNPNRELFLKADKDVPYGTVMKTMAAIKGAGITKIGKITEPEE